MREGLHVLWLVLWRKLLRGVMVQNTGLVLAHNAHFCSVVHWNLAKRCEDGTHNAQRTCKHGHDGRMALQPSAAATAVRCLTMMAVEMLGADLAGMADCEHRYVVV